MNESFLALVVALGLVLTPAAQQTQEQSGAARAQYEGVADYVVGPQDVLTITVFGERDLTGTYTIDSDGGFMFPWVYRLNVDGLTVRAIEELITKRLSDGYLKRPQVTVVVTQFRSQNIYIIGEVRSPGKYAITGNMSMLDALAQAGGATAQASSEIMIFHAENAQTSSGPIDPTKKDAEGKRINLKDLQVGKAGNEPLHDGDTIFVPKAETFFVTGQVRNPGSYVWERGITIMQALSLAGGITERGSNRGVRIYRMVNGKRTEIDVRDSDQVQAGDTIFVRQRFF